ncbi:hypothetical protein BK816_04765 [Boudabousia tangfeifanii]|uniref:Polyprenyl synthetase n=1 Tax=Boudabousia tangfeifanii TaxID=1912795 RepID=A0A1D9MK57_9ACTO|nr:polyprenyl synthetase family protein [Boudabousia tangfeifanii]AOZ72687.1 hypothetical protein BK816_04765 [Boudabousia tangfeifanii]
MHSTDHSQFLISDEQFFLQAVETELAASCQWIKELSVQSAEILIEALTESTLAGKKLRPLCLLAGYALGHDKTDEQGWKRLVKMGAALEFFQASALIHDDLIDHSLLRRGRPTTHIRGTQVASERKYPNPSDFGVGLAILAGDLALGTAYQLAAESFLDHPQQNAGNFAFHRMCTRVNIGQFLDLQAEALPLDEHFTSQIPEEVISYKTAGYSVIDPVKLGALLANLSPEKCDKIADALAPWGLAFQLRDDQLGAFALASQTGKTSGSDLLEGKRTVLLATALSLGSDEQKAKIQALFAQSKRSEQDIKLIQELLTQSGAKSELEKRIARLYSLGQEQLESLNLPSDQLSKLGDALINREK